LPGPGPGPGVAWPLPLPGTMLWSLPRATALAGAVLAAAASHHTATGTMTAYDAATRVLTVLSATGFSEFHVVAGARAWLGNRRLPVSQLGEHAGTQVTVAWSEADGVRTTHTVRLAESRAARAK
jgi:hypothetical protein